MPSSSKEVLINPHTRSRFTNTPRLQIIQTGSCAFGPSADRQARGAVCFRRSIRAPLAPALRPTLNASAPDCSEFHSASAIQFEPDYPDRRLSEMSKRKRVVLNFQQKVEILKQLEDGRSGAVLARKYGIGTSTISDIKRNGESILQFVSNLECQKQISEKKTRKTAQNTDLDSTVYRWYVAEKREGLSPSDSAICAKALEINKQLANGSQNFKASPGWLRHFKSRHGISEDVKEQGSENFPSVTKQLKNFVKRGGYLLENVYKAEESALEWKTLPHTQDKHKNELVTLIVCTNANGSHKLPLWIVGQEHTDETPDSVVYKHQPNVQISSQIFNSWFENQFIPQIEHRQRSTLNVGKVLLILDNTPWHSQCEISIKEPKIDIFYLTDECTESVQPVDLGINSKVKLMYRKKQIELLSKSSCPVRQFAEEFSLTESISLIAEAWNCISKNDIVQPWRKFMSDKATVPGHHQEVSEIVTLAQVIIGVDVNNINRWLQCDQDEYSNCNVEDDAGFNNSKMYSEDSQDEEEIEEPSSMEAHECLQKAIRWFQRQEECDDDELSTLKRLRDLAANKIRGKIKQEKD